MDIQILQMAKTKFCRWVFKFCRWHLGKFCRWPWILQMAFDRKFKL